MASLVALGVTLTGLAVLWVAGLRAESSLDRRLHEIENGALPSMVNAHNLAIATERLRVHLEGLMAADSSHRESDRSAIAGDLAALQQKISSLRTAQWGPEASPQIHDLQQRIGSIQPQTVNSEGVGARGFDSRAFDTLTTSLRSLLTDCDKLIAYAAQRAQTDGQRLKADPRQAMSLQLGTAGTVGGILVGLVLWAESEHRRNEREAARYARTLQDLNAELDAFSGRVAHDLLTPLTPILGSAQIIARGVDPALSRELGMRIVRTTTRLEKLVEGLLSLARTQAGSSGPGLSDAAEVLNVLLGEMAEGIEQIGAEIRLSVERTLVRCPSSLLSTVLQNLLDNALKYGRRDGMPPRVTVVIRPEKNWGRVLVSDEGPGIAAEAQPHIFSPYFQEHPGQGGLGIGLTTARRVVESFGGAMSFHSEVGVGTTFEIQLPLVANA